MPRYRIRYSVGSLDRVKDVDGPNPISALNSFHREIQLHREVSSDRKTVIRESLGPDQYKVTSCCLIYNDDPTGRQRGHLVESPFDLPASPNPILAASKPRYCDDPTEAMPFLADTPVKEPVLNG